MCHCLLQAYVLIAKMKMHVTTEYTDISITMVYVNFDQIWCLNARMKFLTSEIPLLGDQV